MKFRNGDIYIGAWQKDMIHGEGIMVYNKGEKYYGEKEKIASFLGDERERLDQYTDQFRSVQYTH